LRSFYVTGKVGVICDLESGQPQRWLIKVDGNENIVVSLLAKEFQALNQDEETF